MVWRLYRLAICLPLLSCGCAVFQPKPPGEILSLTEPIHQQDYELYKPTYYDQSRDWPVVVLCHAGSWSSPTSVIRDWAELAEEKGLVLVAPALKCTSSWTSSEKQSAFQIEDEQVVLDTLRHLQGVCRVAKDKTFIAGAEAGAHAALYVGLRNPDIFRAVALLEPRFDVAHVSKVRRVIYDYQPVLVIVGMGDWHKDETEKCIEWLRDRGLEVTEVRTASSPHKQPAMAYQFLRQVVRSQAWVYIQTYQVDSPLQVQFNLLTSLEEVYRYEWDFGDGESAVIANPLHKYDQPGEYEVTLKLHPTKGQELIRRIRIQIP